MTEGEGGEGEEGDERASGTCILSSPTLCTFHFTIQFLFHDTHTHNIIHLHSCFYPDGIL